MSPIVCNEINGEGEMLLRTNISILQTSPQRQTTSSNSNKLKPLHKLKPQTITSHNQYQAASPSNKWFWSHICLFKKLHVFFASINAVATSDNGRLTSYNSVFLATMSVVASNFWCVFSNNFLSLATTTLSLAKKCF